MKDNRKLSEMRRPLHPVFPNGQPSVAFAATFIKIASDKTKLNKHKLKTKIFELVSSLRFLRNVARVKPFNTIPAMLIRLNVTANITNTPPLTAVTS